MKKKIIKKKRAYVKKEKVVPVNALAVHNAVIHGINMVNSQIARMNVQKEFYVQCECGRILKITA